MKRTDAKTDLEVFLALAALMGHPAMTYASVEQIMGEIAAVAGVYKGVTEARLGSNGIPWPCIDGEDPGNEILYAGGHPGGKAKLMPVSTMPEAQAVNGLPFALIPGLLKFHSGSMSLWSESLMEVCPEGFAEMNRKDMRSLGLNDGDVVKMTNAAGKSVRAKAKRSRRALQGSVIVPRHFSEIGLNLLSSWDGSVIRVNVEKVTS